MPPGLAHSLLPGAALIGGLCQQRVEASEPAPGSGAGERAAFNYTVRFTTKAWRQSRRFDRRMALSGVEGQPKEQATDFTTDDY